MNDYLVGWIEVAPLADLQWQESFTGALETLRGEFGVDFYQQHERAPDICFLVYAASDHGAVVDRRLLESRLRQSKIGAQTTLVLIACARSRPAIAVSNVKELILDQGLLHPTNIHPSRCITPEQLSERVSQMIRLNMRLARPETRAVNRSAMTSPAGLPSTLTDDNLDEL